MKRLIEGVRRFQEQVVRPERSFFASLARGQEPETLFITCSDSRIDPNLLTQTRPGELFVLRNAGNLVPPYGTPGGEAATIEYAVRVLRVRQIIVCGHSHCGAMHALLHPDATQELPTVREWLSHAQAVLAELESHGDVWTDEAELEAAAVEQNVLVQIRHLKTHPSVAERVATGELKLVGWVYSIETAEVFAFDEQTRRFVPLAAD